MGQTDDTPENGAVPGDAGAASQDDRTQRARRMRPEILLLVENSFYSCFLVAHWLRRPNYLAGTIMVRGTAPEPAILAARKSFHQRHCGRTNLSMDEVLEISSLYPDFSEPALYMI